MFLFFEGPPGESLLPNRLGPFEQDAEKSDWSFVRLRRSIGQLDDNHIPSNPIGSQLIHILEHMSKQLHDIELPTGLQRDRPFQSCLDLLDQSKTGKRQKHSSNQDERLAFLQENIGLIPIMVVLPMLLKFIAVLKMEERKHVYNPLIVSRNK